MAYRSDLSTGGAYEMKRWTPRPHAQREAREVLVDVIGIDGVIAQFMAQPVGACAIANWPWITALPTVALRPSRGLMPIPAMVDDFIAGLFRLVVSVLLAMHAETTIGYQDLGE